MRPCAFNTRFHAPEFTGRSFTELVTMPLSQRKRSSPRTPTRRIQPRSWTAAPRARAAVSASGASNSRGVKLPQCSASSRDGSAERISAAKGVALGAEAAASSVGVIGRAFWAIWFRFDGKIPAPERILIIALEQIDWDFWAHTRAPGRLDE